MGLVVNCLVLGVGYVWYVGGFISGLGGVVVLTLVVYFELMEYE